MHISVNSNNEIKKVGIDENLTVLYVDETNPSYPWNGWSEAKICCYKVKVNDEGIVTMMTPYIDSRLLDHFDQLGIHSEENANGLTDTQMAICDNYEDFLSYSETTDEALETGNTQITDLEMAVCDIYEMITEFSTLMEG